MLTSDGSGSVESTPSQSIVCSRPCCLYTTRAIRSPSRSRRTTGDSSRMQLPARRMAAAMLSYSTLIPLRGYMYFVK